MIRVLVVDDQTLVRQGLLSLLGLADDIEVVGEAANGPEAVGMVETLEPDVLLLDMRMPGMNGIEVLTELAKRDCQPPSIILTTFDDEELVLAGLRAGARGYLLKDVALDVLLEGVRAVAAGRSLVRPAVTQQVLRGLEVYQTQFSSLEQPDPLTERETEILRLMAGGYSNKEIASALHVAEGTVKNHVSNVLSKMGVRDRTRAVLKALEAGLL